MIILEREPYLAKLESALAEVSTGTGRLALVSGEAGIGKTTLVEEFARRHSNSVRVLWGICDALFTPRPLGPLHDIASQMDADIPTLLATNADRTSIYLAVLSSLQSQTTIIVFEDIHWADEGTLDLLRYLGRRIAQTSSLLVATYRDDELTLEHPLRIALADLLSASVTQRILLPPLTQQAVLTLVGEQDIDATNLYQHTGGNPFFVTEVLASGVSGIPATVRDAVLARAARLSPNSRLVLDSAAVIGPRIELWLLEMVSAADVAAVEECMSTGILLAQENGLAFRHELAQHTILETMSPQRRLVLHKSVLEALIAQPEADQSLPRIAHHAEAISDREAVLKYAPLAAQQASAQWAHREAATLYALALRFAAHLPAVQHANLLESYAYECNLIEQHPEGIEALRSALAIWKELGDPLKQGEIFALMTIQLRNHGNNREAEKTSRAAIELLEPLPPSRVLALAYRVQAILRLASRDIDDALSWGKRAVETAERVEAVNDLANAHVAVGSAMLFLDFDRGCAYLEQQLELGRKRWHERSIANLFAYLGSCSVELYQFEHAERYLSEGIAYASERGMDVFYRYMLAWMALAYIHTGRWDEAVDMFVQASQKTGGSVFSKIPTLVAIGLLRARRNDPGADGALDEALELAEPTGALSHLGLVRAARAEAAWLRQDYQCTLEEARAAYELAESKRHPWFTGELAFWRWRAGEMVDIPAWTAEPFSLQITGHWQAAAEAWQRLGCPYQQARALADGDVRAQVAALEIFEQLGAQPDADRIWELLRAAGAPGAPRRPRSSTRDNPFHLTNRQLEILTLLVEDLSNAEIAARLHLSPKTVDHHVSAVLSRLYVHSREEAAALAREHPHFLEK